MTETQQNAGAVWQPDEARRAMTMRSLGPFFALAFGLGWGLAALPIFFPDQVEAIFGPVSVPPAVHPGRVLTGHRGDPGLAALRPQRSGPFLSSPHLVAYAGGVVAAAHRWHTCGQVPGGSPERQASTSRPVLPWYDLLPALILVLLIGPMEEFGWRGVALPLLQRRAAVGEPDSR